MSFILDALRKSELERQRQHGPTIAALPVARVDHRLPWALLAIGLLLALNVGVLLYFLLRDAAAPAPLTQAAVAATEMITVPAGTAPIVSRPVVTAPTTTLPATSAPAPADSMPDGTAPTDAEAVAAVPMPEPASTPPPAPDPTLVPTPPSAVVHPPAEGLPPPIAALPPQVTAGLPELSIDLHVYTNDPAKRTVFINGRRYRQGGALPEGPIVEEITRDGAVLSYRGRRFLLPRL